MKRTLPVLTLVLLLLTACATSHPSPEPGPVHPVVERAMEGAIIGRNIGWAAGILAAVLGGGGGTEDLDDAIDRYRRVRDAGTVIGAVVGAAKGASEEAEREAERSSEFEQQFAELHHIPNIEVLRVAPDRIELRFAAVPEQQTLDRIAVVFAGRTERAIDIESAGDAALDVREALIELGVPASSMNARRVDGMAGVVIHVRA